MQFKQANPHPEVVAAEALEGVVNYFMGDDPEQWRSGITTYSAIVYHELYNGINLRYDDEGTHLKGTYLVAAGADLTQITWRYQSVKEVSIDEETGGLYITFHPLCDTTTTRPLVYPK